GDAGGRGGMDVDVIAAVAWLHSIRSEVLPDGDDGEVALQLFGLLRPVAPYLIPEEVGTWLDQNPDQATGTMPIERIYGPVVFLHALDTGQVPLLDLAIRMSRAAVASCAEYQVERADHLLRLGIALVARGRHAGGDRELAEAIEVLRSATALLPAGHPGWVIGMQVHGGALPGRAER